MSESDQGTSGNSWKTPLLHRLGKLQPREDQIFLALALVIGALTGLVVVAFILLTERAGMRLYPVGGARWRRLLFPVAGSLSVGYLLFRYFPDARGSGVPQTKVALYAREGRITLRTSPSVADLALEALEMLVRPPALMLTSAASLRFK
jgi:H+/Cl- antiporter ClcA